ncbi:MAG: hypothetical protein Q9196_004243 [Gyalolechia fulgens]
MEPKSADSITLKTNNSSTPVGPEIPDPISCEREKSSAPSANELSAPVTTHSEDNKPKTTDTNSSQDGDATCSKTLSTLDKTDNGDIEEDGLLPDVLYRTRLDDPDHDEFWNDFRDDKFPEWSDPRRKETKPPSASKLEIIRTVDGSWQGKFKTDRPKSMEEHQWRRKDLYVDFKKQFKITGQRPPEMLINDPIFRDVMKSIIRYDPSQLFTGDEICIEWPWKILMHYRKEIVNLRDTLKHSLRDGQATVCTVPRPDYDAAAQKKVESIDLVLNYIQDDYEQVVAPELRNHSTLRVAEFAKLWLLFRPGEEVFATVNGKLAAFIVLSYRYHEAGQFATTNAPIKQFIVHVWNLRFVAGLLVRHMSQIAIDTYEGTRLIETLPVYPCEYAGSTGPTSRSRQKLIEKGKRYFSIISQRHAYMEHKGLTRNEKPRQYNGPVIIDSVSYVKYGSNGRASGSEMGFDWLNYRWSKKEENSVHFEPLKPSDINEPEDNGGGELWKRYIDIDPLHKDTEELGYLEDRHYLLCPSIIRGFSLRDKQWETYDVDKLSDVKWEPHDNALNDLVLEPHKKKQIKANCRSAQSRQESPDLLEGQLGGKGAGTVILLHGPPGVGKTYTVGCVAKYTGQPLLSLSGCDMGSTRDLEQKVQHWLDLATAWDAIVLLDEADIFLTYRQKNDMDRNLLVSVFLQAIESFQGILFLATNRIGQLDIAINSRIDLDINFKKLEGESKEKLWQQFFDRIPRHCDPGIGPYITKNCIRNFFDVLNADSSKFSGGEGGSKPEPETPDKRNGRDIWNGPVFGSPPNRNGRDSRNGLRFDSSRLSGRDIRNGDSHFQRVLVVGRRC